MRPLKFEEQKLLKKVDFLQWKNEDNIREIKILRKYHIQKREDFIMYSKLSAQIQKLSHRLLQLQPTDTYRIEITEKLLDKLYNMGVLPLKKSLSQTQNIAASAFCRRRLPVVLFRLKYAQSIKEAVKFIEQGHIRVGPEVITDPAFLVTRYFTLFLFFYFCQWYSLQIILGTWKISLDGLSTLLSENTFLN